MKKNISLFVCIILLLSAINSSFVASAKENNPPKKTVITFDDNRAYKLQDKAMEIALAPEHNGKKTKALHIKSGQYDADVCLNEATLAGDWNNYPNSDPVFTFSVKPETTYRFSCLAYLENGGTINYGAIFADINNFTTYNRFEYINETPGQWVKIERIFKTTKDQSKTSTFFNFDSQPPEFWFDDFVLEELPAGIFDETDKSFCEVQYNFISDKDLADINKAKSGRYEIELDPNDAYTFGINANGSKKTSVFLSFDGENPIPNSQQSLGEKRQGYLFTNNGKTKIYLVVNNPDSSLKISDAQVFKSHNLNNYIPMGHTQKPKSEVNKLSVKALAVEGQAFDLTFLYTAVAVFVVLALVGLAIFLIRNGKVKRNEK